MSRSFLPYHPSLKPLAKKLRHNMTFSEVKLWNELKQGRILGYYFDQQRPIANYIVDFFCQELMLAIEVDGITHEESSRQRSDVIRQKELEAFGLHFIRVDALLVVNKVQSAVREIYTWIVEYEKTHGVPERVMRRRMNGK